MRRIIHNEWRYLIRNRLVQWITLGFAVVLVATIFLGNLQQSEQAERYQEARKHLRDQWDGIEAMNPHGAAHYGTYAFKPTTLLSSLDEGVGSQTGNVLRVEGHVQNEMVHSEAVQMQAASRFGKLKSSLLLKYIVPLLLIFLAFDSVSREKKSGRLKLLMIQGAKPLPIVFAKTTMVWIYGVFLLLLVMGAFTLISSLNSDVDLGQRSLLFFLSYTLYFYCLSAFTVFFSTRWKNATAALTSMLGIWILWTIFLPNIFLSSVEKWHPLPSRNEFQAAMKEDRAQGLDGHNPSDERGKALEQEVMAEYGVDSLHQLPINFDGIRMQADEEYGNQVWDKHFGELRNVLARQKRSLQWGGLLTPFIALQNASMGFTGTDNYHHQEFLIQVEDYRRMFIKTLNDKHAYGGSTTGDWGWMADNDFFRSVPEFQYQPTPLAQVLPGYLPDLGILLGWTLLTSFLLLGGAKNIRGL